MVKPRFTLFILSLLGAALSIIAQQVSVQAPRSVVEGNVFQVQFVLEGGSRAEDIKPGKIEGCTELSGPGVTSSSYTSIINGHREDRVTTAYAYTYRAVKAGTYTIPAATLTVGGRQVQTRPTEIRVLPPDQSNRQAGQSAGNTQVGSTPEASQQISKSDIFVRIIFNRSNVYEGEAVECTLKLYTKYNSISGIQPKKLPVFDGFLIEELENTNQENDIEHYNGQNYLTAILKKYIIFPQKAGQLSVSSGEYDVVVTTLQRVSSGFWGYTNVPVEQTVKLAPTTAHLSITPLPTPAPASFTGAVGKFTLESRLNAQTLRTNEAASITTIVTGTGNIKYVKCPAPVLPSDFEQYTPAEDVRTHVQGATVTGTVSTEYTFVPQSVGQFTIAPVEFTYFDPSKREYVTLTAQGYTLDVARGASATTGNVEQNEIKQRATDILHIHPIALSDLTSSPSHAVKQPLYWTVWILVVAIAVAFLAWYRKRVNLRADVVGMKTARAGKVAKKRLRLASRFMKENKREEFYAEILNALWGYISDRLAIPGSELTRINISEKLSMAGMNDEDINHIISIIDECEMARYTPETSNNSPSRIYEETSKAMDNLERIKPAK